MTTANAKIGTKIHLASVTFYVQRKGSMQGDIFADANYPKLIRKVLKSFESVSGTTFTVQSAKAIKGETYQLTLTHPSWSEPYVQVFTPQSERHCSIYTLLIHLIKNTVVNNYTLAETWRDMNWMTNENQLSVIESSYLLN